MEGFRIVDLSHDLTDLIQQVAHITYEAAQTISLIWLPTIDDVIEEI